MIKNRRTTRIAARHLPFRPSCYRYLMSISSRKLLNQKVKSTDKRQNILQTKPYKPVYNCEKYGS